MIVILPRLTLLIWARSCDSGTSASAASAGSMPPAQRWGTKINDNSNNHKQ